MNSHHTSGCFPLAFPDGSPWFFDVSNTLEGFTDGLIKFRGWEGIKITWKQDFLGRHDHQSMVRGKLDSAVQQLPDSATVLKSLQHLGLSLAQTVPGLEPRDK